MAVMLHSGFLICRSCRMGMLAMVLVLCGLSACQRKEASNEPGSKASGQVAPSPKPSDAWNGMESLADGKWVAIEGAADLAWDDGGKVMRIGIGNEMNGVRWTGALPAVPYVVELEARRVSGSDFFCGLTFPVRSEKECVSLIVGGWGGSLVGISSIEGLDASENSTGQQYEFEQQRWYRIRVEVKEEQLQVWIDDRQVIDVQTEGQKLSLRPGPIEDCAPFGLATWMTQAEIHGVKWRKLAK